MEAPVAENIEIKRKIYREKSIWVGTMLGSPLVGGYMMGCENLEPQRGTRETKSQGGEKIETSGLPDNYYSTIVLISQGQIGNSSWI